MMTSKTISVSDIEFNPYRDLERNPMSEERIQSLMDSIERNDLWRGIVARPIDGGYQIAFGHHRLEAIKRLDITEIEVDLANLSDAQMLQYLSDENLNQGGKSPAAAFEVVVAARFMLDRYLRESETPEEFLRKANITTAAGGSGEYSPQRWGQTKAAGVVGRDILRRFLSTEHHGPGWANSALALGINYVDALYREKAAKAAKERAAAEYEELTKESAPSEEKIDELSERQRQADRDLDEAAELVGYRDILEMFPYMETGTVYVRELKRRADSGKSVPKTDQLRFARQLVNDGTGKRDIPRRLGELIDGKAVWEKEEKRRAKERQKAKDDARKNWKKRWEQSHSITPDQYVRENLGLFNQMDTFLDPLQEIYPYIEDEDLIQAIATNSARIRDKLNVFAGGLPASAEKVIS